MPTENNFLLNALFRNWNHYTAVLPYNLNWSINLTSQAKGFLKQHPLTVCDIGARGFAPPELMPFYSHIEYHAFDADKEECERLNLSAHPYHKLCVFPYFVGRNNEKINFNLYKKRGSSSVYKLSKRFTELFADNDDSIEQEIEVNCTSLDTVYLQENLEHPDFLKIDTQGTELDILEGSKTVLKSISLIEVEVEFIEMYAGQPLFHDIAKFFADNGFELLYLNRVFAQRQQIFAGPSRGQITFADALFGRREDYLADLSSERLVKYCLLLINYGHIDFAYHLTRLYPEIQKKLPVIEQYFSRKTKGGKLKRAILSQLDKLSLILLNARKYNQLNFDSDRSWPIR